MADVSSEEQEEEKRTDYSHDEEPRISLLLNKDSSLILPAPSVNKVTPTLIFCIIATVVGSSAQFGFNTGVINNVQTVIRQSLNGSINSSFIDDNSHSFSNIEWAATVSIFAVGGMFGALPAGALADTIGRKWTMMVNNGVAVVGVVLQALAINPYMLIVGRFVVGVNSGINTVVAPLYISEISPVKYRGTMGTFVQLSITSTILLSQVLGINVILGRSDSDYYGWRILLAIPLIFVLVQVLILPWCPESPRYLLIRRRKQGPAEKALGRLCGHANIQNELRALEAEFEESQGARSLVLTEFLTDPVLRRALVVSIVLHMSQQVTGIGSIFKDAGIQNGDVATSVMGVVLVLGTTLTILLIDRVGRRTLMLYGLGGMAVFFALVSSTFCFQYAFYPENPSQATVPGILLVVFTFGVTFSFALGPGGIPWLMVAELFQQEARPFAISIATIVNWLSNFAIGFVFPFMLDNLKPYPFIIFMAVSSLFWLFMFFYLPETKGKTIDQITSDMRTKTNNNNNNCPNHLRMRQRKLN